MTTKRHLATKPDRLLRWRKEFPILRSSTYLISNSLGAMPRSAAAKMSEYTSTWAKRGVRAWADSWWEMARETGNTIAPLLGAGPNEIALNTNVTSAQALFLSAFRFKGRKNEVVISDLEFPSVIYMYQSFGRALGARIRMVHSEDGVTIPTEQMIAAINERTLLVSMSHVCFKSAFIQDVKSITEHAHRHGAYVILDTYHSVGCMPVDVNELEVDAATGGVLKWLCGGTGGVYLWIQPTLRDTLSPLLTGWFAHEHPFAFSTTMRYTTGAYRFMNGTPSIPPLYTATEGIRVITKAGVSNIRKKSKRQTGLLVDAALERGFEVRTPLDPELRGGTVTINIPHGYEVSREMLRREIIIDFREGAGIRFAPHFYNSDEEIAFAISEMTSILHTKQYRRTSAKRSTVT